MRRTLALLAALTALLPATAARAQTYGSIVRERYVACHDEAELAAPAPPPPSPGKAMELVPVPRRPAPGSLQLAPLLVIDVAVEQPIPSKQATPAAPPRVEPPPEAVVTIEGENDYHCIGVPRGKARILRVVAAGPGTRFGGGRDAHSYRRDNLLAAGMFDLREAIPSLRRELDRPLPASLEPNLVFDRLDAKLAAMRALADLEDVASVARVVGYLRGGETASHGGFWAEGLETLDRLDPTAAQRYAIEVVERAAQRLAGDFEVRAALPLVRRPSPQALAALKKLGADTEGHPSGWHDACTVLAARLRAGDEELARALRPELAGDLTTNRSTVCYSEVIGLVFPGDDPDEVDTLLRRHRYDELLRLVGRARRLEAEGKLDRRWADAAKKMLAWLQKHRRDEGQDPVNGVDVASGRITNGVPETNAKHLAAMAALGDAAALRDLYALVDDPRNPGTGPWIAARLALRFDFEGAADHAAGRLRLGIEQDTQRFSRDSWPRRGQLTLTEHGELVDALARRKDPRFALGLLDRDAYTRDVATQALARDPTDRACELVGGAAGRAEERAIQQAFWAMSVLGDACRDTMWRLASDRREPPEVKGMALEALAMTRDRRVRGLVDPQGHGDRVSAARARARIIYRATP